MRSQGTFARFQIILNFHVETLLLIAPNYHELEGLGIGQEDEEVVAVIQCTKSHIRAWGTANRYTKSTHFAPW